MPEEEGSNCPPGLFYTILDEKTVAPGVAFVQKLDYTMHTAPSGRKVAQFGPIYDYATRAIGKENAPIPEELVPLTMLINEYLESVHLPPQKWNQCIINRYLPGEGIAPHTDHPGFGPIIACFTCEAGRTMQFTEGEKSFWLYTEVGSLYVMSGLARAKWRHQMVPRLHDFIKDEKLPRGTSISVTFRTVPEAEAGKK